MPADGVQQTVATLNTQHLAVGIGSARQLAEAHLSLNEAQMAAQAAKLLNRGQTTSYSELGADRLLLGVQASHPEELEAFVRDTLGPLLKHDARSANPLLPTLRAFLEQGGHLRDTAEALYVHRNTLAYRLDRAAELLGVDLKDGRTRLALALALRALPLVSPSGS